jgi:hypothetical protein
VILNILATESPPWHGRTLYAGPESTIPPVAAQILAWWELAEAVWAFVLLRLPGRPLAQRHQWLMHLKEAECGTEVACSSHPCYLARCLHGSPRAWGTTRTPSCTWGTRTTSSSTRSTGARRSCCHLWSQWHGGNTIMSRKIAWPATSSSGVALSDTELIGSASPDPTPARPLSLALGDEWENPLSRSWSHKSDSTKNTRRLGFFRCRTWCSSCLKKSSCYLIYIK